MKKKEIVWKIVSIKKISNYFRRYILENNYIKRKTLLYKTGVEYGDYSLNHVLGCSHGCKYPCYAMLMAKRFGRVKSYDEWVKPKIVINSLELLEMEIPKYKNDIKFVHLCFTTDPFMFNHPEVIDLSLRIINKLNENDIKCTVLTKGILPEELLNTSKDRKGRCGMLVHYIGNYFHS